MFSEASASELPRQMRRPPPKGKVLRQSSGAMSSLIPNLFFIKRSGLKRSGSSYDFGSCRTAQVLPIIIEPFGMMYPSKILGGPSVNLSGDAHVRMLSYLVLGRQVRHAGGRDGAPPHDFIRESLAVRQIVDVRQDRAPRIHARKASSIARDG